MGTPVKRAEPPKPPKSELHRALGRRLKELRRQKGLSQEELAGRIGMSVDAISNVERGVTFTTLDTLVKVAAALEVSLVTFFDIEPQAETTLPPELARVVTLLSQRPEPVRRFVAHHVEKLLELLDTSEG